LLVSIYDNSNQQAPNQQPVQGVSPENADIPFDSLNSLIKAHVL